MADSDDLDLDGGDVPESGGSSKKRAGGLGNLLPTILKFVAIGIGAMIFIVTVSVVTYNIMQSGGKSQTDIFDPSSPYRAERQEYSFYTDLGPITTKTSDRPISSTVTVQVIIGYDLNDQAASSELVSRRFELRDYIRRYFSGKTAIELRWDREEELKKELREHINQRIMGEARVREIFFDKLDVMQDPI